METIDDLLWGVLKDTDVPSVAAAIVIDGKLHAAGAVGVRKRGNPTPVTVNDKYHLGSCTKAMTATLVGIFVERGLISWDLSLKSVFPKLTIHPDYEPVTLKQLLSHTSGMPAFTNPDEIDENLFELFEIYTGSAMNARLEIAVPAVLSLEPRVPPGKEYLYSNMGYITAGAMLEQLTQTPFETLLEREYFAPLGLTTGGFGAAGTTGQVDEPWGHGPEPIEPEPEADNPLIFSPAGRVHMSVLDFAKSAMFHLSGRPKLVSLQPVAKVVKV